jgi:hypothetical protein
LFYDPDQDGNYTICNLLCTLELKTLDCMQNVPFFVQKIGGAKLYWNKCIKRCESTQQNPNQKNLTIFKDNQQNFGKNALKMMKKIVAVGFASVFTEFIFLDLYFYFFIYFYLKISYLAVRIKLC